MVTVDSRIRRRKFDSELHDLSGVIRWLHDHGLAPKQIADILPRTPNYVNVSIHRDRQTELRMQTSPLLTSLDARDSVGDNKEFFIPENHRHSEQSSKRIQDIEERVEEYGEHFWERVRFLGGTAVLGQLLQPLSRPADDNYPLLRLVARVYHFKCETYLHAGYARSALQFGLKAYGYSEHIYRRTRSPLDLERLAKTVLLISNSCNSRRDIKRARKWLKVAEQAFAAVNAAGLNIPDPEYLRQMASVQRNTGNVADARKNLKLAAESLAKYKPSATRAAIKDMGDRVLYVIADTPQWDKSQKLLQSALREWPEYDSHRPSNLNWTAACGLLTDSPSIQQEALDLLEEHQQLSQGFGLQSTATFLLQRTPRVPANLRREWVLFSLSYNAYSNK